MADNIQATPRNYLGGLLSDAYKWMQSPERTQQMQGFAGLLGTTGLPQTIERMAYGEPLTNIGRANVPLLKPETADALMTVAPMVGPAARGAEAGLLSAGRAGERYAERVVPQIMERGGMPAQLLGDLSQGSIRQVIEKNPAPFIVKHGTNQPFDEFKSGMGVTAKHIYTTPEEYAQDAAKYGDTLITAKASPKSLIDFSSEGKLDKQTISALKKAAKDAGITDKYYPFESFIDDVMSGQLYQKGGGSRDQDALLSELFSKYQAVKMPDATSGGGISKSVVFEDPSVLKVLKDEGLLGQQEKQSFTYPQEEAMRLAQQRAALPKEQGGLGLLANNTADERAAAMGGQDAIHFSRTGGDFNVLDSGQYAVAPFDAVGTHVGTKEAALDRFRNTVGTIDTPKGSTYPVQVLGDRPLMNEQGLPWGEDELNAYLRKTGGHNWSDVNGGKMTYQDMNKDLRKKLFEEQGYTSIPYVNDVEAKGAVSYIVPPDNLRSRFAAFDPWRKTAATAAAMGVAAPDLLAQEQPVITQQQIDDELARYGLLGR